MSSAHPASLHPPPLSWPRSVLAGAVGAVATLAVVITLGVLALAPLGEPAARYGVAAAFACTVVSASVMAGLGRAALPVGGPSSATALIIASLLAQLLDSRSGAAMDPLQVLLPLSASVVLMGLVQVAMARMGWGRLIRFVPQPVLAGFMNGVALLVLVSQVPVLLVLAHGSLQSNGWRALVSAQPAALLLGLGTAACIWTVEWRWPRAPAALVGLVVGSGIYHLVQAQWPASTMGPLLDPGEISAATLSVVSRWADPTAMATTLEHGSAVVVTGILLALVGTLESALSLRAIDQAVGERHDERHELTVMGLANVAGGLVGALPTVLLRARAVAILQAGGRGRSAIWGSVGASVLLFAFGAPLIALLPQAVLAGVMVTIGVLLIDRWSRTLLLQGLRNLRHGHRRSPGLRQSLTIVAVVCALTVGLGPAAGVAVGVLLSAVTFMRGMNRSLLRARFTAASRPSRRIYPRALEARLQAQRQRLTVIEMEGALYFGSSERLADEADTLPADCRCLVLDFRRVSAIDESGAMVLAQLAARLTRRGTTLLLSHVGEDSAHGRRLRSFGVEGRDGQDWFPDADHAIEAGERLLLGAAPHELPAEGSHVPARANALFTDLDDAEAERLLGHLRAIEVPAGATLFRQGDPADGLYLVVGGSISIVATAPDERRRQRYVTLSPGTLFGEMAMLDGGGRTADAVADTDAELLLLSTDAFQRIAAADPVLGSRLHRNIAHYLAERLRVASAAWTAAAS